MIGLLAEWNVHQNADISPHPIAETIGGKWGVPMMGDSLEKPLFNRQIPPVATVLLLDAKTETRERSAACLRGAGWRVLTAGSCEEARLKMKTGIDVVLLDLLAGDETDLTVVEFLNSVRENAPPAEKVVLLPSLEQRAERALPTKRPTALNYRFGSPPKEPLEFALRGRREPGTGLDSLAEEGS
jgi:CheY-like chemotaxis protein